MKLQSIVLQGFCFLISGSLLFGNPSDPTVISGNVTFSNPNMSTLAVTSTDDRSIVEWDDFSIGLTETTTFSLPSAGSAILNRVTSTNISEILGSLQANGQVFLINQNGILIDSNSVISTGAVLASTLDVDNQEFLDNGPMTFAAEADVNVFIYNYGSVSADLSDVVLLGYQVLNRGSLTAENGTVALGAGVELVFDAVNDPRIAVVSHSNSSPQGTGIDHETGSIQSLCSLIKADGNQYQFAINIESGSDITVAGGNPGNSLCRIEAPDGSVTLDGSIRASDFDGDYGGVIEVLGDEISVNGNLDASSNFGNGSVYVGGGFQGMNPDLFNATDTTFDNDAVADVSAVTAGNGGLVVIWADDTTNFFGTVNAKGGANVGDGGAVEISGVQTLNFYGTVDVSAPMGSEGTLTLDPIHLEYHPLDRPGTIQAEPILK